MSNTNLYNSYKIFYHADKIHDIITGRRTAPIYIRIKPTNMCNQKCYYCCYNGNYTFEDRKTNRADYIPWTKMEEIINDMHDMSVKAVTFSGGGDPLCYPFIQQTLDLIIKYNIDNSIITNGQALEGACVEKLANSKWVRISLDSANEDTYYKIRNVNTFHKVITNIENFAKIKNVDCQLGINFVVANENHNEVYAICKIASEIGVNNIKFSPYLLKTDTDKYHRDIKSTVSDQINKAKQDFKQLLITDKYSGDENFDQTSYKCYSRCRISEIFTVIAADCKVYMCHQKAYTPTGEIGSLENQSFKELWFDDATIARVRSFDPSKLCENCCVFDERNAIIDSIMNVNKDHINFI